MAGSRDDAGPRRRAAPWLAVAGTAGLTWALVGGGSALAAEQGLTIRWCGQSCFVVESGGFRAVMDPVPPSLGYPPLQVTADLVTVSHEHFDHNYVAGVTGSPQVLRGLTGGGSGWATIDQQVGPVHVRSVPTYHDDARGAQRGRNAVFVLEWHGLRLVHLGDLGHRLDEPTVRAIGRVDVLLVPVGGFYTIDAAGATAVVESLKPAIVIPMHYRTPATGDRLPIATADAFLAGKPGVRRMGNQVTVSAGGLPTQREIWVLEPPRAGG